MRSISKLLGAAVVLAVVAGAAVAQPLEPLHIINHPTAGMLPSANYWLLGRAAPESSLLGKFSLGFKGWLMVGLSYGVHEVFAYDTPQGNSRVGFQARIRVLQETHKPALALGFDNQGYGRYDDANGRYARKSPGFYAVLSKNYKVPLGDLSAHGGLSLSTEADDDHSPNVFAGLDYMVWQRVSFLVDFDAALNDNVAGGPYGQGGVYLDAGVRGFFTNTLEVTLIFRDLTANSGIPQQGGRAVEIAWISAF